MIHRDATIIASFLGALLVFLLLYLDKYEREPIGRIGALYGASILATGLFGVLKYHALGSAEFGPFVTAYGIAGVLEEALKFGIFLLVLTRWQRWIDERFDCLVYLGVIALGFSVQENIGYYIAYSFASFMDGLATEDFSEYHRRLHGIALIRALPGHLLFDLLGAAVVARGYRTERFGRALLGGFVLAVFLHGTWNLLGGVPFIVYAALLVAACVVVIVRMLRRSRYWGEQRRWRGILGRLQRDLDGTEGAEDLRAGLVRIRKKLAKLPLLPGVSQRAVFLVLEQGIGEPAAPTRSGLREVERVVDGFGTRRHDWFYWSLLVVLFLILGIGCTWLTLVAQSILVF
ncbi:MAG: PrsW family intramembrane metalloprotease [Candidatus Latescibacteria bacterium]|nr:PrsW family intramembrane metalloprotease [Candidatus Latescibacterota bacterium]